jgi:phosphatidate cytidylyltransferase
MLRTRVLTAVVLIPVVVFIIYLGDGYVLGLVAVLLGLAEMEFCQMMARDGYRVSPVFGITLVWMFLANAYWPDLRLLEPGLALAALGAVSYHMAHREGSPVADWALTLTGGLYVGLCGGALIRLRALEPDGLRWTLVGVFTIMVADSAAYFVGRALGRRRLAPQLSPGKTWEGYAAGVAAGGLWGALMGFLWPASCDAGTAAAQGLVMGLLVGVLAPLGDLAVSMMKRQVGVKDTGTIIKGHGGALDRVDSVLWTGVLVYYYVWWALGLARQVHK